MANPAAPSSPRWRSRLAWLCVLWISGVAAMGLLATLLRWLMRLVGMVH
jgi:hypothetical protein